MCAHGHSTGRICLSNIIIMVRACARNPLPSVLCARKNHDFLSPLWLTRPSETLPETLPETLRKPRWKTCWKLPHHIRNSVRCGARHPRTWTLAAPASLKCWGRPLDHSTDMGRSFTPWLVHFTLGMLPASRHCPWTHPAPAS